ARVHGLEHVEGLATADLTDHDAVGSHTQRVPDEVANGDLTATFDVRGTGFHRQHVVLVELKLLGVLDGDDALVVGDERRHHVQGGRLTGTGTAGHNDVEPSHDARLEEAGGGGVHGAEADEVLDRVRVLGELPD